MSTDANPGDAAAAPQPSLAHYPITVFGITMGVLGLALALRAGGFEGASVAITVLGALVLILLGALYGLKSLRHAAFVAQEWHHPVRLAFFPAANISILLLSLLLQSGMPALSAALWIIGAVVQAILTVVIVSAWISHRAFGPAMLSPAWFIPAVANVILPLGGAHLGYLEVSWYFFSVGLLFWLILLTLVFNRLIFHDPLPGKLRPTLVILIAPPSVGFLAWLALNGGQIDALAHVLLSTGVFFAALVAVQVPALLRLPFAMSFWALSFPLAALTTAMFRYADLSGSGMHRAAGLVLLCLLGLTILGLGLRTIRAAMAGEICQPE
ncbi:SLAC1 anion channel family protein [Dinoroseobacter sp. PD6]|uniref:SLAC1 anion channel family protein n=1 Tax=Dinoroseobacter sp. PD6 TaxID=3028384 RepID=UPI00237C138F|nr:SLAC1 anion channel family protein [Dinoroseobacter sp. PD6]MDD9717776.1 SLAC1 anion channel family protein [Dinoroseobacter sp. PD6]